MNTTTKYYCGKAISEMTVEELRYMIEVALPHEAKTCRNARRNARIAADTRVLARELASR